MTSRERLGAAERFLSRRSALRTLSLSAAVGLASPMLIGCAGTRTTADGLRKVRLTQAVNSLAYAQNYIAKHKGYYRENGLEVETIVTDGGGPDVQAVLANSAEFTINDGPQVLTALAGNRSLVAVAATFRRCLVNVTMSVKTAKRLDLTDATDLPSRLKSLKGLRIGVTAPGALTWQLARFDLSTAGLDPDRDAEIVALGGGPAVLAGLENDQVDVIYISVPFGETAIGRKSGITLIDNSAGENPALSSFMMEGLWTSPETVERDPDLVSAMVKALGQATAFLAGAGGEEVLDVLAKDFAGLDTAVLSSAIGMLKSAVAEDSRWDAKSAEITTDVLAANGLLKDETPPADRVFDARFLA